MAYSKKPCVTPQGLSLNAGDAGFESSHRRCQTDQLAAPVLDESIGLVGRVVVDPRDTTLCGPGVGPVATLIGMNVGHEPGWLRPGEHDLEVRAEVGDGPAVAVLGREVDLGTGEHLTYEILDHFVLVVPHVARVDGSTVAPGEVRGVQPPCHHPCVGNQVGWQPGRVERESVLGVGGDLQHDSRLAEVTDDEVAFVVGTPVQLDMVGDGDGHCPSPPSG